MNNVEDETLGYQVGLVFFKVLIQRKRGRQTEASKNKTSKQVMPLKETSSVKNQYKVMQNFKVWDDSTG